MKSLTVSQHILPKQTRILHAAQKPHNANLASITYGMVQMQYNKHERKARGQG